MFDHAESGGVEATGRLVDPAAVAALPKAERLALLRQRMGAVPGRVGAETAAPVAEHDLLRVPGALGELLPHGGLLRGTVVACPRGVLVSAFLAAATATSQWAAVVGQFAKARPTLIDVWEMGGKTELVALADVGSSDPAEIVHVLVGGVQLVVLWMPRLRLTAHQVEILRSRVRSCGAILMVAGDAWSRQAHMSITYRRLGDSGIGKGRGRFSRHELDVQVRVQGRQVSHGHVMLAGSGDGRTRWTHIAPAAAGPRLAHTG